MTNQQPAVNEETARLLQRVYRIKDPIHYEVRDGVVFIIKENNAKIQKVLRKIRYKIPKTSEMELDEYGSFIFQQIDGVRTVGEIAELLGDAIEEANNQLYDRLIIYMHHLEKNEKYIELVKK
ncbi:PqqD family protein [Enterococcus alishanensis]|uniref:PqqD family protein n=1 Tax=Enterococcus alishanensis TaxID=1303817 RepID=A0ABS6TCS9_9ENTE|nr:PqqD family protein [Enterococcus alishanensis]MBV7390704.1 PqqD family protein [Enterococcus alishanensis]